MFQIYFEIQLALLKRSLFDKLTKIRAIGVKLCPLNKSISHKSKNNFELINMLNNKPIQIY